MEGHDLSQVSGNKAGYTLGRMSHSHFAQFGNVTSCMEDLKETNQAPGEHAVKETHWSRFACKFVMS